jgi:acyl carrier protein
MTGWVHGALDPHGWRLEFNLDPVGRTCSVASIMERVTDIVSEQLGVDKDKITAETSFVNDLGADSLDTVELVMELEEEFDINIPDDAAEKIQTVGQAVAFIEQNSRS